MTCPSSSCLRFLFLPDHHLHYHYKVSPNTTPRRPWIINLFVELKNYRSDYTACAAISTRAICDDDDQTKTTKTNDISPSPDHSQTREATTTTPDFHLPIPSTLPRPRARRQTPSTARLLYSTRPPLRLIPIVINTIPKVCSSSVCPSSLFPRLAGYLAGWWMSLPHG